MKISENERKFSQVSPQLITECVHWKRKMDVKIPVVFDSESLRKSFSWESTCHYALVIDVIGRAMSLSRQKLHFNGGIVTFNGHDGQHVHCKQCRSFNAIPFDVPFYRFHLDGRHCGIAAFGATRSNWSTKLINTKQGPQSATFDIYDGILQLWPT